MISVTNMRTMLLFLPSWEDSFEDIAVAKTLLVPLRAGHSGPGDLLWLDWIGEDQQMTREPEGTEAASYFQRESSVCYWPTHHVSGGWNPQEQHIAPAIGLLAHAVQRDMAERRQDGLQLARLSCDILGVIPMESVKVEVELLRPGRTIELVQARLSHAGRDAVLARAWLTKAYDSGKLAGSELPPLPPLETFERWGLDTNWPGGFVRSTQIWRRELAPGRVQFWLRGDVALIEGEPVGRVAHMLRLIDVANGVSARAAPEDVLFPNLDLTVHLFREPVGDLIGLDSTQSFGPTGLGLTETVLHDEQGPFGTFSQILTVRPRA